VSSSPFNYNLQNGQSVVTYERIENSHQMTLHIYFLILSQNYSFIFFFFLNASLDKI